MPRTSAIAVTIHATRLFSKDMSKKFRKCEAVAYAAVNDKQQTVQYFNLYHGKLTAGYKPEVYTFEIKPKAQKKLDEGWEELEPDQWPEMVVRDIRRRRKS
jgi:hypothetical protein